MAGGRSTRMRATAGPAHKAMIEIGEISLIERNVRQLLGFGFRTLGVVVSSAEKELHEFVVGRIAPIAAESSAQLSVFVEAAPLGNIGFVGTIKNVDDVLVTYVDNLTGIDAKALLAHHRQMAYDLTIATHVESVPLPYGVLQLRDGLVVGYDEKPVTNFVISSGTCVVGRRARDLMPQGVRVDARELFRVCSNAGVRIGAYLHTALWVDVNDAGATQRASDLMKLHPAFMRPEVDS
ncbi:MAG: NTP transferase domain-containing protein [Candidatus Tumulicola sp.]